MQKIKTNMKMNKKYWIAGAVALVLLVLLVGTSSGPRNFKSESLGLGFTYSPTYALKEIEGADRHSIVVFENTKMNRDIMDGKVLGTEGPTAITLDFFPEVSEENIVVWMGESLESNFQLSDGRFEEGEILGHKVVAYKIDGLYGADVVAMKHNEGVLMITGQYLTPEDAIRVEFANLLASLTLE